jgi:hypothetical protein
MSTERIGSILPRIMTGIAPPENRWDKRRRNLDIESVWHTIIDSRARAHSYAVGEHNGTVTVKVDSSVFLFALNTRKKELCESLRKETGRNIRNIVFLM